MTSGAVPGAGAAPSAYGRSHAGLVGLVVSAVVAGATIWLLLTDPVTVADAVGEGSVSPFIKELAAVVVDALRGLLRYL